MATPLDAKQLLAQHERLRTIRAPFEATWTQIAERIAPSRANFTRRAANSPKGEKRTSKIFDAVPALALHRFAAAVHSLVTPKNQTWQRFKSPIEKLNENVAVQRYYDELTRIVFAARYASNFDNQVQECYTDLGAFNTMALFIGDTGKKILYRSVPMYQAFLIEDAHGNVDGMSREFNLTARQAVAEYDKAKLPNAILSAAERQPETEFEFVSYCGPRGDQDVTRMDYRGMAYCQYDVCRLSASTVLEEGYTSFPYACNRYSVTAGEVYGRGPSEIVLPDINMLNDMNKTGMQGAQMRALPAFIAGRDGILDTVRFQPGAVNYGGIDSNGREMIKAIDMRSDVGITLELMDQKRKVIQDAFWNTLFMILVDSPTMTATEAMLRAQEKGALLAPTASRIESEFLAVVVKRELAILARRGLLPMPPPELLEAGPVGYEIEYDSPMARARMAEDGVGMLRTWEQLATPAQIDPTVYKRFNFRESAKILARINGYPAKGMFTDDEMDAMDQQQAAATQAQQLIEAAPLAASAAKDLAAAGSLTAAAPAQVAPGLGLQ